MESVHLTGTIWDMEGWQNVTGKWKRECLVLNLVNSLVRGKERLGVKAPAET